VEVVVKMTVCRSVQHSLLASVKLRLELSDLGFQLFHTLRVFGLALLVLCLEQIDVSVKRVRIGQCGSEQVCACKWLTRARVCVCARARVLVCARAACAQGSEFAKVNARAGLESGCKAVRIERGKAGGRAGGGG
jgi:hypothetical protein